ncbi:MAG: DUF4124 domain-containing protein [Bacterioplanes sp.]|nr:DUF4124 domain-containing protein [Bacterioplanes sp.]
MGFYRSSLLLIGLLSMAAITHAQTVYRWVDEHGQTHFSEHPRPGMNDESITLKVTPARPATQGDHHEQGNTQSVTTRTPPQEPEKTVALSPAQAQQLCRDARQALTLLSERFNRRFVQPDGSVRPLTDEERAAQTRTANDAIARYCR